jgi:putative transposase
MGYPTDLTDEQWAPLEPVLCRGSRGPRPSVDRRVVVDAILYQARTDCQWRYTSQIRPVEHHLEGVRPLA